MKGNTFFRLTKAEREIGNNANHLMRISVIMGKGHIKQKLRRL